MACGNTDVSREELASQPSALSHPSTPADRSAPTRSVRDLGAKAVRATFQQRYRHPPTNPNVSQTLAELDKTDADLLGRFTDPAHIVIGTVETAYNWKTERVEMSTKGMHHLPSVPYRPERTITFTKGDNAHQAIYLEIQTPFGISHKFGDLHTAFDPKMSPAEVLEEAASAFDNSTREVVSYKGVEQINWTGVSQSGAVIKGHATIDGKITTAFPEWEDTTTLNVEH